MKNNVKRIVRTVANLSLAEKQNEIDAETERKMERWSEALDKERLRLDKCTYVDYNIDGFYSLINSIETNGLTNFNMNTFMSKLGEDGLSGYDYVHEIDRSYLDNYIDPSTNNLFDKTTNKFNCDTVGCISGFATAVAMNWEEPKWFSGDSREYSKYFEVIACSYLNIPVWVGRRIFYGDEASAWAFAKLNSHFLGNAYDGLKVIEYPDDQYGEDDFEDIWDQINIELSSISYKDAVNLLTDIAEGKILFGHHYSYGVALNPALVSALSNAKRQQVA